MLGGLARWLRAAGYSAEFDVHIKDGQLVREALREGKVVLTSDSGVMDRFAVEEKLVRTVFVPLGLSPVEQLSHVMAALGLPLRESRCMECNGELDEVPLAEVRDSVPQKVAANCRRFFRCRDCEKVFWHGTHWRSISERLKRAEKLAASSFRSP